MVRKQSVANIKESVPKVDSFHLPPIKEATRMHKLPRSNSKIDEKITPFGMPEKGPDSDEQVSK